MNFDDYLRVTKLCNHDDSKIVEMARKLRSPSGDARETALRIFEFVRNSLRFEFRPLT